MARVWLAEEAETGRRVALKVLSEGARDPEARRRFEREARLAREAAHECLVPLVAEGLGHDPPWLAYRWMERGHLGALRGAEAASLVAAGARVAAALAHLHGRGIVHRDVKPENVLLDSEGKAWLADLGLGRAEGRDATLTQEGMAMGTPGFLAPEVLDGEEAGAAADVFALGAMLGELLTGVAADRREELERALGGDGGSGTRGVGAALPAHRSPGSARGGGGGGGAGGARGGRGGDGIGGDRKGAGGDASVPSGGRGRSEGSPGCGGGALARVPGGAGRMGAGGTGHGSRTVAGGGSRGQGNRVGDGRRDRVAGPGAGCGRGSGSAADRSGRESRPGGGHRGAGGDGRGAGAGRRRGPAPDRTLGSDRGRGGPGAGRRRPGEGPVPAFRASGSAKSLRTGGAWGSMGTGDP